MNRCLTHPSSFCPEAPTHGDSCVQGSVDWHVPCEYSGGVTCYCQGNPPVEGAGGVWVCFAPPPNSACPEILPNLGDGCSTNGVTCRYGIMEQGCWAPYAQVFCYQGAWEIAPPVCLL
jgi:hypothetical protein